MTTILEEAAELVNGARQASYGHPAINHGTTAELWAIYLGRKNPGVEITAEDVCFMNMLQKISRHMNSPKRDNLVDLAGYAENAGMIAVLEEEREEPEDIVITGEAAWGLPGEKLEADAIPNQPWDDEVGLRLLEKSVGITHDSEDEPAHGC